MIVIFFFKDQKKQKFLLGMFFPETVLFFCLNCLRFLLCYLVFL